MWQPRDADYYACVPLAPGERYVPINAAFARGSEVAFDRPPRFVREGRATRYA